jgi:hypothetical protein
MAMDNPANTVVGVVTDWLQAVCRKEARRAERDVDHAVWETFPASDPISPYQSGDVGDGHDLRLLVSADSIRIVHGATADASEGEGPTRLIVGETPDGATVRLAVQVDADAIRRLPVNGPLADLVRSIDPALASQAGRAATEDAPNTPPEHA